MRFKHNLGVSCSAFAILLSSPALAQSTTPTTPEVNAEAPSGDIIVTALKRSSSLQKVPAAISVVSSDRLTQTGVTNLTQITNVSTAITIIPVRTLASLFVRGIGQILQSQNADGAVALNLNGVFVPAEMSGTAFFDVDRVEILPGPQGTLYGASSTGGVINIESRKPGDKAGIDGFVEVGNYGRIQVLAGLDYPISDTLSSRTAVTHIRHDGYNSNGEDDQLNTAVRETLVWKPGAGTTVTAVGTYTHSGGIGNDLHNVPDTGGCGFRCDKFDAHAPGYYTRSNVFQGSLQLDQQLSDELSLTYVGGYNYLKASAPNPVYGGPPVIPAFSASKTNEYSHELRINADIGKFKGFVGGYYYHNSGNITTALLLGAPANPYNFFESKSHSASVFGQATYSLTDVLRITGGARYSHVYKNIDGFNGLADPASVILLSQPFTGGNGLKLHRADWKAGVEFDVAPHSMLYANVGSGFTPGGFSSSQTVVGTAVSQAVPFKPITLTAYTAGVKNRLADGMLTLNFEGFYYDYKNYQVNERDPITVQAIIYNAAKATVYGGELNARLQPDPNDDLSVNVTYLHTKANNLITPAGNFSGISLFDAPTWTANAFYQHAFDLPGGAQLRANANFKYTTGRWTSYKQDLPGYYIKPDTHTDVNLGYFAAEDHWSVSLFVRNLENNLVKSVCGAAISSPVACYFEPPRTYGGRVALKF